jgi:hypothetical protein
MGQGEPRPIGAKALGAHWHLQGQAREGRAGQGMPAGEGSAALGGDGWHRVTGSTGPTFANTLARLRPRCSLTSPHCTTQCLLLCSAQYYSFSTLRLSCASDACGLGWPWVRAAFARMHGRAVRGPAGGWNASRAWNRWMGTRRSRRSARADQSRCSNSWRCARQASSRGGMCRSCTHAPEQRRIVLLR